MSYISIQPELVREACTQYFTNREAVIESLRNEQINKLMQRRFFAPKTREEAIKKLKAEGMILSKYELYELYDMNNFYQIGDLFDLSEFAIKNNNTTINLSSNHVSILKKYFDKLV